MLIQDLYDGQRIDMFDGSCRDVDKFKKMTNLISLLFFIFVGVFLMVFFVERFAGDTDPEKAARLSRWIMPLVGLMLILSTLKFFLG